MSFAIVNANLRKVLPTSVRRITKISAASLSNMGGDGSGAGKGGGSGGSIRDAGGSFGKREAAAENIYFHREQEEQLKALHDSYEEQITSHEAIIKKSQEAIAKAKASKEKVIEKK